MKLRNDYKPLRNQWLMFLMLFVLAWAANWSFGQERFKMEKKDFQAFKLAKQIFQKGQQYFLKEKMDRAESDVGQTHPELKKAVLKAMEEPEAVIVLKSGEKIKGSIQSETGSKLVVKGNIEIKKDNIESINRQEGAHRAQPVLAEKREEPKETGIEEEPGEVSPQKKTFLRRFLGKIRRRQNFYFKLNLNYLQPQDSEYKEVYGSWTIFQEMKAAYRMTEKLSFWLGYGKISGKTTIPILEEEAESSQKYLSFGLGYTGKITKKFSYNIDFGLVSARYTEAAMGEEVGDSVLGFRCDGGLCFNISKLFFTDFSVRYIYAASSVSNNVSVKTGGIGAGIGLGVKF